MSYEKLSLASGDILTAEHIKHLEDGIAELTTYVDNVKTVLYKTCREKGLYATKDEDINDLLKKFSKLPNYADSSAEYPSELLEIEGKVPSGHIKMVVCDTFDIIEFKIYCTTGFYVDWGDGTITEHTYNSNGVSVNHTYTRGSGSYYDGLHTQYIIDVYPVDTNTGRIYRYYPAAGEKEHSYKNGILSFVSKDVFFSQADYMFTYHPGLKYVHFDGGSIGVNNTPFSANGMFFGCTALQSVIGNVNWEYCTDLYNFCRNCNNLINLELGDTWNISMCSDVRACFNGCYLLEKVPYMNLTYTKEICYLYANCRSLKKIPIDIIDASKMTNLDGVFANCHNLIKAPNFINTSNIVTYNSMFSNCRVLTEVPELDFSSATDVAYIYQNMSALTAVPRKLYFPKATSLVSLLSYSLIAVAPEIDAPECLDANSMFLNCVNFTKAPKLNLPKAKNVSQMFYGCKALKTTLPYYFPNANNLTSFYYGCTLLENIPEIISDMPSINVNSYAAYCTNLITGTFPKTTVENGSIFVDSSNSFFNTLDYSKNLRTYIGEINVSSINQSAIDRLFRGKYIDGEIVIKGLNKGINMQDCNNIKSIRFKDVDPDLVGDIYLYKCSLLNADALNQIFNDLPTITKKRVITITGCEGNNTCDTTIATSKGWNVVK